jgi:hypothetical protein
MSAHIDSSVDARVAGNLQHQAPLVLVVVDPDPGLRLVDGTEDTALAMNGSDHVKSRIGMLWSGLAEAEGVDFLDAREMRE